MEGKSWENFGPQRKSQRSAAGKKIDGVRMLG